MSFAIAFCLGGVAAALTFAVCLRYASAWNLLDHPEGRKEHATSTPVVGGFALASAIIAASTFRPDILHGHLGFLLGALILVAVGVWDDLQPVAARFKLLAQVVACGLAIVLDGVLVGQLGADVFGMPMGLGIVSTPFTLLVMLTVLNGVNLIDGIDGLAGGLSFVGLALFAKASFAAGLPLDGVLVFALLGGLSAFLCLNFPFLPSSRAQTFLGDAGSLLLGFALVYFAIKLSALPHRVFKPTTALWFFTIPVFDAVWLYLRRSWFARQPFRAGRDHLHHLLMRRWSARTVCLGLVGVGTLVAGLSYLSERWRIGPVEHLAVWLAAFAVYGVATHSSWLEAWRRADASDSLIRRSIHKDRSGRSPT